MSVAQLLRAQSLCPQTAGSRPHCPHPRAPARCQSMGRRKKVRPREVLPRVQPGRKYTGLAVVLSNPALVFPLTASLPENAARPGWVPGAAVSPLDGKTDGQTAWAGVRLCGSDALCTRPPCRQGPVVTAASKGLLSPRLAVPATLGDPRGSVRSPRGSGAWRVSLVPFSSCY